MSVSYKINDQCSEENHSEMEYDLIAFSPLTVSSPKVLFEVSKEKFDDPSIAIVLYQLRVAQLEFSGNKELGSAGFGMTVVLDDSDTNHPDLWILNEESYLT